MIETKLLPNITCIYKIVNLNNPTKIYIGSALRLKERIQQHISCLRRNKHHSYLLQRAFNKYGLDNFNVHIVDYCSEENIKQKEQFYLDNFECFYNISSCADRPESKYISKEVQYAKSSKSLRGKGISKNKSTGISNVSYLSKEKKYAVTIQRNNIQYVLNKFSDIEKAIELADKYRYAEIDEIENYLKHKREVQLSKKSSQYKGVQKKHDRLWRVIINNKHICYCKTELEAARTYNNHITVNKLNKPINIIKSY